MKPPHIHGLYGYKLTAKSLRHPPGDPHGWAILLACLTVAGLALLLIHLL
ncbi:potassium transporter 7 [Edwardsiella piscicida]|nr:potassium transporter 7 [Edwardsiella piscicida]